MKSLILINTLSRGGAEKVVSVLWDYQMYADKDIHLSLLKDEVTYSSTKDYKVLAIDKDYTFFYKILRAVYKLKNSSYDVIQSHLDLPNTLNCVTKVLGSKHTCQIVHCVAYSNSSIKQGSFSKLKVRLFDYLFSKADLHIFKSYDMYEDYLKFFTHIPKRYVVIYNPYDFERMNELSYASNGNIKIKDKDKIKFVIVCRLSSKKSVDVVLKSLSLLDCSYQVNILGDGPELHRLKSICMELGITDKVNFLGFVSNPYPYYMEADYYLSASQAEGFPNTLVEAMYYGCIPIHSNCVSGPREILCSESNACDGYTRTKYGYLFEVNDHLSMSEAIKASIHNDDYLNESYKESIKKRVKLFSVAGIAKNYIKVIKNEA